MKEIIYIAIFLLNVVAGYRGLRNAVFPRQYIRNSYKVASSTHGVVSTDSYAAFNYVSFTKLNSTYCGDDTLVYLPGIDGLGSYSVESLKALSNNFSVWSMRIDPNDRSTFAQITHTITTFIRSLNVPVTILGESVGGLMAAYIGVYNQSLVSKLILVNPATSFDRTAWAATEKFIPLTGLAFTPLFTSFVLTTVADPSTIYQVASSIVKNINTTEDMARETLSLVSYFNFIRSTDTLLWRMKQWLDVGNFIMKDKIRQIKVPTLVLVGNRDGLLPSQNEAFRLEDLITEAQVEVNEFPERGHALLAGNEINILEVLRKSRLFRPTPPAKKPIDFSYPSQEVISYYDNQLKALRQAVSPVFLHRRPSDGKIVRGLGDLPVGGQGRPVLYVGNHQLFGKVR